jgi:hypothetical protein
MPGMMGSGFLPMALGWLLFCALAGGALVVAVFVVAFATSQLRPPVAAPARLPGRDRTDDGPARDVTR